MTQQIRKNVFETNSSSSHSLTMSASDVISLPFSKETLREGTIRVTVAEYGWEYFRYYKLENKLSYLLTQVTSGKKLPEDLDDEERTQVLRETYKRLDKLCCVVEEFSGVKVLFSYGDGCIDHDSVGVGMELLDSDDDDALRRFLFSDSAYIETSNDNSGPPVKIGTDKGEPDHYYKNNYAKVPDDYVAITLRETKWPTLLLTDTQKPLDEQSDLYKAIRQHGIVTRAVWTIQGGRYSHNPFKYHEKRSYTMAELAPRPSRYADEDEEVDPGFKFTEEMSVDVVEKDNVENDILDLTIRVPAEVAAAYRKLG